MGASMTLLTALNGRWRRGLRTSSMRMTLPVSLLLPAQHSLSGPAVWLHNVVVVVVDRRRRTSRAQPHRLFPTPLRSRGVLCVPEAQADQALVEVTVQAPRASHHDEEPLFGMPWSHSHPRAPIPRPGRCSRRRSRDPVMICATIRAQRPRRCNGNATVAEDVAGAT